MVESGDSNGKMIKKSRIQQESVSKVIENIDFIRKMKRFQKEND